MSIDLTTGASVTDVGGHSVVRTYGNVVNEYHAIHTRAAVFDRSHRGRLRLHGPRAAEMLNGLVTNDVATLDAGHGCYAAALTAKGKIVSDLRIYVDGDGALTDAPPRAFAAWAGMVRKFVNPRISRNSDETGALRNITIVGVNARHVLEGAFGIHAPALAALADYAHLVVQRDGHPVMVARTPELGVEGFDLFITAEQFEMEWDLAVKSGATPAGLDAWEIARVEAGRPEWGVDMDDSTIPQEANFDELHAISYTKGCYVGQETVARVHFRGHVNKHLRGILAAPGDLTPQEGATLHDENGLAVGEIRSAIRSPRLGGIALGMVRREVAIGARLVSRFATADDATVATEQDVTVSALPFSAA